jgi:hypothetical protein
MSLNPAILEEMGAVQIPMYTAEMVSNLIRDLRMSCLPNIEKNQPAFLNGRKDLLIMYASKFRLLPIVLSTSREYRDANQEEFMVMGGCDYAGMIKLYKEIEDLREVAFERYGGKDDNDNYDLLDETLIYHRRPLETRLGAGKYTKPALTIM